MAPIGYRFGTGASTRVDDWAGLRLCLPEHRDDALLLCALGSVYGVGPVSQDPDCAATDHE